MKNTEIVQEVLIALHAMDKLDEITRYLRRVKQDTVPKEELLKIIEKEDQKNDYF